MKIEWQRLLSAAINNPGSSNDTYCRFYHYSFTNRMLFFMQGLNEPVGTYKAWQKVGRQVKRGEKGSYVWVPRIVKDKDTGNQRVAGFFMKKGIFGYSQTEGDDLQMPEIPGWNKDKALNELGINEIPFNNNNGNVQGFATKDGVAINPVAKFPLKTLLHEIAHKVMDHKESNGVTEFQAETCAYILMHELKAESKFDADASRHYIQNWLKEKKLSEAEIKPVFTTVEKILKAGQ